MSDHDQADVVIVGAGMVGASLAVALRMLQLRVTVIEAAAQKDPQQPSYDDRSTALSYGSRRILEGLGLWPDLSSAATPIHTIHVSDRGRFGATRLTKEELQVPALGYVVENRALGQVLWRAMEAADVDIRCPAKIRTVTPQADSVRLQYAPAAEPVVTLESRLLVAADGLRSPTRQLLGIDTRSNDYGQMAVIANVTPERFHEHVAYERFTSAGPIAFLPLANGRCSVVWTAQPHDAAELCDMDDEDFLAALQKAFGYRLGALQ
ncbi:MAG: FAD-dependent monooxygenase, partial [Gammaproteobacteria bacterium]|nr:FAD-dependent monooxygenase [Gammaproteobacteria bacterium]